MSGIGRRWKIRPPFTQLLDEFATSLRRPGQVEMVSQAVSEGFSAHINHSPVTDPSGDLWIAMSQVGQILKTARVKLMSA